MKRPSGVLVGVLAVLLTACTDGGSLLDRQAVDPVMLLYSNSRFAGVGDFEDMKVTSPAGNADVPGWPHAAVKVWNGAAPQVWEQVMVHDDAGDAANYFQRFDPRKKSLEMLWPDKLVGPSKPYAAPGSPDSSQIYCDHANAAKPTQCDSWMWWARYGQYTVTINVGGGPDEHNIDRAQFERVVALAAGHIGRTLGS